MSDGWAAALVALVESGLGEFGLGEFGLGEFGLSQFGLGRRSTMLPILTGLSLTVADLDEIRDLVTAFTLQPFFVPDLSGSLDGHLSGSFGSGPSPLTSGGTTLADLNHLSRSSFVAALGATAKPAAVALSARTGTETYCTDHLSGLAGVDAFVSVLAERSGLPVPAVVRRWRARFTDGLLDSHFVLGGARVAVAGEPELLVAMVELLSSVGAEVVVAVSGNAAPVLKAAACAEVVIGDLEDLRERAEEAGAELVIGSSHAHAVAGRLGAAHLPAGMPIDHRLGATLGSIAGYRGGLRFLFEAANRVLEHREQADARPAHRQPPVPQEPIRRPADALPSAHALPEESRC